LGGSPRDPTTPSITMIRAISPPVHPVPSVAALPGALDLAVVGQQPGIDRLAPSARAEHVIQFFAGQPSPRRPVPLGVCGFEQLEAE
jgi:hypothetical protein